MRSSAQLISYELGMGLAIITVVLMSGSLGLQDIVERQGYNPHLLGLAEWNLGKFFPMGFLAMIIYTITMLAETNRAPFDLPEAETELVAGYHTEYTSMKFATFFMGEYANMIVVSAIAAGLPPSVPALLSETAAGILAARQEETSAAANAVSSKENVTPNGRNN